MQRHQCTSLKHQETLVSHTPGAPVKAGKGGGSDSSFASSCTLPREMIRASHLYYTRLAIHRELEPDPLSGICARWNQRRKDVQRHCAPHIKDRDMGRKFNQGHI